MGTFVEDHKVVLLERIERDAKLLEELKQKDISGLDGFNKKHYERTIKNLESNIEWNQETVRLIDEGKIES